MSGYVKIYGSILGSSVWAEPPTTRIVWITMLALADQNGNVEASVSGLARFANITPAECRKALIALSSPDEDSKSPEHEGRRVEKWERGWTILNYIKYREMRSPKQVADAERQQRHRARDVSQTSQHVATAVDVAVAVAVKSSSSSSAREGFLATVPNRIAWESLIAQAKDGGYGTAYKATDAQIDAACLDFVAAGGNTQNPSPAHFRAFVRRAVRGERGAVPPDDFNARLDAYVRDHPDEGGKANA